MFVLTICFYKKKKFFSVTQIIWIHFFWWAVSNWHSRSFVKHCVLLWVFLLQEETSTLILTCRSKLLLYYLSKGFMVLAQDSQSLNNVPLIFKERIHYVNMFDSDSAKTCNGAIPEIETNLKKICLSTTLLNEFTYPNT